MKKTTKTKDPFYVYVVIEFTKKTKTMPSMPKKIVGVFPTLMKAEQCANFNGKVWRNIVKVPYFE